MIYELSIAEPARLASNLQCHVSIPNSDRFLVKPRALIVSCALNCVSANLLLLTSSISDSKPIASKALTSGKICNWKQVVLATLLSTPDGILARLFSELVKLQANIAFNLGV
jgi:hypothetical protein